MPTAQNTPRICIIGAGFSGLCMGIKLKTELKLETFTIYEACEDVGGTWLVNKYPGCACDVPGILYSYSFAPKYDWSKSFAPQTEILEYIKDVTHKYDLYPHIKFNTRVESLRWDDRRQVWHATVVNQITSRETHILFDIVVNGTGKIRIPHYPKEYLGFNGPIIHSADWDHSVVLDGKRVGLIGTGASAVQLVSALTPKVSKLTVFQRRAPYIIPRPQSEWSDVTKWIFANVPGAYMLCRMFTFLLFESTYNATRHKSWTNKAMTKICSWYRNKFIAYPVLLAKTTPDYTYTCKRPIISDNYYSCLIQSHVDLVTDAILKVDGNKICTQGGTDHELDVLILATGYQPHDFFSPMKVSGVGGVDVLDLWRKDRPRGYLGILTRPMPNFFTLLGPYTASGHNSNIFQIECQVDWSVGVIKMLIERKARSVSITKQAEDDFIEMLDKAWKGSTWANEPCESWYMGGKQVNTLLYPETHIHFWKTSRNFDENLFEFKK